MASQTQPHRFTTEHRVVWGAHPNQLPDPGPVHLVVTSPPYPMVAMWDDAFSAQSSAAAEAMSAGNGPAAFEAMHRILDPIWEACFERLVPGGFICVNVGDATRTIDGSFQLYSNHARTIQGLLAAGFGLLPDILWRKPTNAPNKFMGSGMLPAGAYVTYEHEYIIVARKGGKRSFRTVADRARRRRSAFFWEERNQWFSDLWQGLTGTRQHLDAATRKRRGLSARSSCAAHRHVLAAGRPGARPVCRHGHHGVRRGGGGSTQPEPRALGRPSGHR